MVAVGADVEKSVRFTHVPLRLLIELRFGTIVKSQFFVRKSLGYQRLVLGGARKSGGRRTLRLVGRLLCLLGLLLLEVNLLHGL